MMFVAVLLALTPNPLSQPWERGLLGSARATSYGVLERWRFAPLETLGSCGTALRTTKTLMVGNGTTEPILIRMVVSPAGRIEFAAAGLPTSKLQELLKENWDTEKYRKLFSVYVVHDSNTGKYDPLPILGSYRIRGREVVFTPQFPLVPGLMYRAVFRPRSIAPYLKPKYNSINAVFPIAGNAATAKTVVAQVYPRAATVPENLLKFYIYFSAPMSRGRIYDHIHLRNEAGKDVELPFLEIAEELWDPSMTRLTLFIDPGRIKRGVRPLEEVGPALEEGKRYSLTIDREWRDAANRPLKEPYSKWFAVGPSDRQAIDPSKWKITPPAAESRGQLVIEFEKPMDRALAERVIKIRASGGGPVAGEVALAEEERRWTFSPNSVWKPGVYEIVVETILEDLAGNNIGKPFEVDLFEGIERRITAKTVTLSFEVK